jgi:dihydropteroate synthase
MHPHFERLSTELKNRPLVMGILNVTPDSFSDGGRWLDPERAVEHALAMAAEGADLIDVGGESTRPGAQPVGLDEELARVIPVLKRLRALKPDLALSIDTFKAEVARQALDAGACLINDQSALTEDTAMPGLAAGSGAGVCLMHRLEPAAAAKWSPQEGSRYGAEGVTRTVHAFLEARLHAAGLAGLEPGRVWLDPGLGFGKSVGDNLRLLRELGALLNLGCPLLVGPSRKSFVGAVLDGLPVEERLEGTLAACATAVLNGASVLRVHDVRAAVRAARLAWAVRMA